MAEHIQTLLAPDMRERGSRGVALTGHIGPLRKRDRLEISESVTDVHQNLSTFSRYPIKLNFFRECKDSMVNHPSPLLAKPNGTMRLEHFVGGFLHTFDEGVAAYLGGAVATHLFEGDVYGHKTTNKSVTETRFCEAITRSASQWYATAGKTSAGISDVSEITMNIAFGSGGLERHLGKPLQQPPCPLWCFGVLGK